MTKTYWTGKETSASKSLRGATVSYGLTENAAVNAHIISNRIYYDVYNDNEYNLFDSWVKSTPKIAEYIDVIKKAEIGTVFGKVNLNFSIPTIKKWLTKFDEKSNSYTELERFMDEINEALVTKDLEFPVYKLWNLHEERLMTIDQDTANSDDWKLMTFGLESERDEYINDNFRTLV